MAPLLEVRDVRHDYGGAPALQGVSFSIERGEMFGLLGPNGAGKSTLLSLISGLRTAAVGAVLVDGRPLVAGGPGRERIGLVPQELALYPDLTAAENLRFFAALHRVPRAVAERRVGEILDAIGLRDRADDRAGTFSGGMQRRLNLGIALVHDPELILLDEPTAGVDPQSRNHLFEGIRRLHAAGKTMLYTSHYMEEVEALCTRIGILDHGRLVACDTLTSLLGALPGSVRFRVEPMPPSWPGFAPAPTPDGDAWRMACADPSATAAQLATWCAENRVRLTSLETAPPNLERLFFHLTGRALRD